MLSKLAQKMVKKYPLTSQADSHTIWCMNDEIISTIDVLTSKVAAKEEEANKLKKLVNELCGEAEIPIRYPDISETAGASKGILPDAYYGQTLTAAIRNYLESRKASGLGAAAVLEIFRAIKAGGYKFETRNDENAKISVGNALRKTSSIFHRLPNGQYGLLAWYPSAKAAPDGAPAKRSGKRGRRAQGPAANGNGDAVTHQEIRDVILAKQGEFQTRDIEAEVKAKFPGKQLSKTKIPSVIFILKKDKGLLKEVSARSGKKAAVYTKI
jgi:hypothetical protein